MARYLHARDFLGSILRKYSKEVRVTGQDRGKLNRDSAARESSAHFVGLSRSRMTLQSGPEWG